MYQKEVSECRNVTVQKSDEQLLSSSIRGRHKSRLHELWELAPRHSATELPQHKLVCLISNAMSLKNCQASFKLTPGGTLRVRPTLKNSNDCACRYASNRPKSTSKKKQQRTLPSCPSEVRFFKDLFGQQTHRAQKTHQCSKGCRPAEDQYQRLLSVAKG